MSPLRNVRSWLDERFGWDELAAPLRKKTVPVRHPGGDRNPAAVVLQARSERGLRERAVHHDSGAIWLADSVDPFLVGELNDFYRLRAHVQRAVPEGIPQ